MCSMEMKKAFRFFGKDIYYADHRFVYRGFWYYNGKHNVRLIAFNRFTEWFGDQVNSKD